MKWHKGNKWRWMVAVVIITPQCIMAWKASAWTSVWVRPMIPRRYPKHAEFLIITSFFANCFSLISPPLLLLPLFPFYLQLFFPHPCFFRVVSDCPPTFPLPFRFLLLCHLVSTMISTPLHMQHMRRMWCQTRYPHVTSLPSFNRTLALCTFIKQKLYCWLRS